MAISNDESVCGGSSESHDRLVPNVVAGWAAHGVALVIGFVMPRLIDESVGQTALGVWDLGWSLLMYLGFSGLGMAVAITHHVAKLNRLDPHDLRISIASGFLCQLLLALALGAGLGLLFLTLPDWAPGSFADVGPDMRWVGLYLGLAIAAALIGDVAQGILTGHHRSSWNEYLSIVADVTLALAMLAALLADKGIVGLAFVTCCIRLIAESVRMVMAFRVCPEASFAPALWRAERAWELLRFAGKASLGALQELIVQQGVRVFLIASAGPGALAAYSRYQTVVRQITRLVERSVRILPAMASELAGQDTEGELNRLRERASRATALMALPMIAVVAVLGDEIVVLWMGPSFTVEGVAWILAAMALLHVDYAVSSRFLMGLNAHGRIAAICFGSALLVFAALYLLLRPLDAVDAAAVAALSLGGAIYLPHYFMSCARLGTSPMGFLRRVYLMPLAANGLFLAGLMATKLAFQNGDLALATLAIGVSGLVLAGLYWRFGFAADVRAGLVRRLWTSHL